MKPIEIPTPSHTTKRKERAASRSPLWSRAFLVCLALGAAGCWSEEPLPPPAPESEQAAEPPAEPADVAAEEPAEPVAEADDATIDDDDSADDDSADDDSAGDVEPSPAPPSGTERASERPEGSRTSTRSEARERPSQAAASERPEGSRTSTRSEARERPSQAAASERPEGSRTSTRSEARERPSQAAASERPEGSRTTTRAAADASSRTPRSKERDSVAATSREARTSTPADPPESSDPVASPGLAPEPEPTSTPQDEAATARVAAAEPEPEPETEYDGSAFADLPEPEVAVRRFSGEDWKSIREERVLSVMNEPGPGTDPSCYPRDMMPLAQKGKMSKDQVGCVQKSLAQAEYSADQARLSLVLIANAQAREETDNWEWLVARHLEAIDEENPGLAYRYSLHMYQKGLDHYPEALHWANIAIGQRAAWTGATYHERVTRLYKVRAAISQALWQQAEKGWSKDASDANRKAVLHHRDETRRLAVEWYRYALETGMDTETPLKLCANASIRDRCDAEVTADL
ncbi:MAG: hypothetical protein EA397_19000 [Deltaproteobacteria bacterium]|nr:MAG: hypothetical protein EA397_19000 [Deltaproteobacteria bacterium]